MASRTGSRPRGGSPMGRTTVQSVAQPSTSSSWWDRYGGGVLLGGGALGAGLGLNAWSAASAPPSLAVPSWRIGVTTPYAPYAGRTYEEMMAAGRPAPPEEPG